MDVGSGEVEAMVIDPSFWRGRRVLLTGHTGFKGSWTSLLLSEMGAETYGLALPPDGTDSLFEVTGAADGMSHSVGDIRDLDVVRTAMERARPEIVLHMAAQALVRPSYEDPVGTYATNVMGTVHVLEAARQAPDLQAVVVVTSDKCYENVGSLWGYREPDMMGGHDPYSNSKGCAELVTSAYRRSFFQRPNTAHIASGRAGNVIGGGDWSTDRLVPDAMRAFIADTPLRIRNPAAVRPWQHVLDPVLGYLRLAEHLATAGDAFAEGWNFGPAAESEVPVRHIVDNLARKWGGTARWEQDGGEHPHEAAYLKLDCTKAAARLGWRPLLSLEDALDMTVSWYAACNTGADMRRFTIDQINDVLRQANAPAAPTSSTASPSG
ncbi:CDP-glucose 4,6-dehydratase [Amorphus suaedae]